MKLKKNTLKLLLVLLTLVMVFSFAACGEDKDNAASGGSDTGLDTVTAGKLTIATGEPAWEPWVINDDPTSGEGYESAVAYAIAEELGYAKEDVVWVRTGFEEAIQPGLKTFDFNMQQFSITDERKEVVDFASAYYTEPRVIITGVDSKYAKATTIADFKDAKFGGASGDIAIEVTNDKIQPSQEVAIFNDLATAIQALSSGQIDALVVGQAEGYDIVSSDQVDGVVVGSIPGSEDVTNGIAPLLEKDSPITAAVSKAIDKLIANGTLDALKAKWLSEDQFNTVGLK